jgi:hypothetical protein
MTNDPWSPPMPGRHQFLDDAKCREICALVSFGCTLQSAAKHVGCSRATVHREACRNPEFAEQLRCAERDSHLRPVRTLSQAACDNWRAAAWLLERTCPEEYARKPANLVRIETVQEMVARFLEVIEAELSDSPQNQELCVRLTQAIEETCESVATAARTNRHPARLRQVINESLPAPPSKTAHDVAGVISRHESPHVAN